MKEVSTYLQTEKNNNKLFKRERFPHGALEGIVLSAVGLSRVDISQDKNGFSFGLQRR